jgi:hypothetical protein
MVTNWSFAIFPRSAFVYFWTQLGLLWSRLHLPRGAALNRPTGHNCAKWSFRHNFTSKAQASSRKGLISFKLYLRAVLKRAALLFLLNGVITFQLQLNLTHASHAADVGIGSRASSADIFVLLREISLNPCNWAANYFSALFAILLKRALSSISALLLFDLTNALLLTPECRVVSVPLSIWWSSTSEAPKTLLDERALAERKIFSDQ